MLRGLIICFALVLLGAVVWSVGYEVSPTEVGKIAVIVLLILLILVYIIIKMKQRSRRKTPPPE
jgi:membrane protein DedA with SNARE-associated domain